MADCLGRLGNTGGRPGPMFAMTVVVEGRKSQFDFSTDFIHPSLRCRRGVAALRRCGVALSLRCRCGVAALRRCLVALLRRSFRKARLHPSIIRRCVVGSLRRWIVAALDRCVVGSLWRCFVALLQRPLQCSLLRLVRLSFSLKLQRFFVVKRCACAFHYVGAFCFWWSRRATGLPAGMRRAAKFFYAGAL